MFENAIQSGKRLRVDMGQYILQTSRKNSGNRSSTLANNEIANKLLQNNE